MESQFFFLWLMYTNYCILCFYVILLMYGMYENKTYPQ